MKILVEKNLLYGYLENGDETNGYDERVSVDLAVFIGGHATIERATMAALQILYANGPRDVDTLGQSVLFYIDGDHTNILITLQSKPLGALTYGCLAVSHDRPQHRSSAPSYQRSSITRMHSAAASLFAKRTVRAHCGSAAN